MKDYGAAVLTAINRQQQEIMFQRKLFLTSRIRVTGILSTLVKNAITNYQKMKHTLSTTSDT